MPGLLKKHLPKNSLIPGPWSMHLHLTHNPIQCQTIQLVLKSLSATIGCKARGSAFSAKRVLDVLQHASEPFSPRALTTSSSLDLATKQVLKPVVRKLESGHLWKKVRKHEILLHAGIL